LNRLENTVQGNVYKVYIKGKNIIDEVGEEIGFSGTRNDIVAQLDINKNDGVYFNNINDNWFDDEGEPQNVYYSINPNQIKLADGTNTTFDGDNPDIRFAKGGVAGDIYSIKNAEYFKQIMTIYNELTEKFGVNNYFLNQKDNSVVFLMPKTSNKFDTKKLQKYFIVRLLVNKETVLTM
jgi:hypothetical protein